MLNFIPQKAIKTFSKVTAISWKQKQLLIVLFVRRQKIVRYFAVMWQPKTF